MQPAPLSLPPSTNGQEHNTASARGLSVADLASLLRVSKNKIRNWIGNGTLKAINVASNLCQRPRWIVLPESLAEFQKLRASGSPTRQPRRRRQCTEKDWYP